MEKIFDAVKQVGEQKGRISSLGANLSSTRRLAITLEHAKDAVERMATPAHIETRQGKIMELEAQLISIQSTIKLAEDEEMEIKNKIKSNQTEITGKMKLVSTNGSSELLKEAQSCQKDQLEQMKLLEKKQKEIKHIKQEEQKILIELDILKQQELIMTINQLDTELTVDLLVSVHKDEILELARPNFSLSDMESLEIQLNEYLETPEELRTVDKKIKVPKVTRQELYVFYKNGELAGFSGLEFSINNGETTTVLINWTGVHEKFKRNGIGSRMLNFVEERARMVKCFHKIGVKTCDTYSSAMALYEKSGFVRLGNSPDYFGYEHNLFEYQKSI